MVESLVKLVSHTRQKIISFFGAAEIMHRIRGYQYASVLCYHSITHDDEIIDDFCFVSESEFDEQIKYLSDHFEVIHLSHLSKYRNMKLSKPLAIVTFDDGFYNNYEIAFPILKKYNVPASIFITTSLIDSNDTVWFCHLINALQQTKITQFTWLNDVYDISSEGSLGQVSSRIQSKIKEKHPAVLNKMLEDLFVILGYKKEAFFDKKSSFAMLTTGNIKEMKNSKLVEFGAHTHNHYILSKLTTDESEAEIYNSIKLINSWVEENTKIFSYPNGRIQDYTDAHKKALRNKDIEYAVSTEYK